MKSIVCVTYVLLRAQITNLLAIVYWFLSKIGWFAVSLTRVGSERELSASKF